MKGLVVVHTENSYISGGCVRTREAFERIADELKQNWWGGRGVYYLPGDGEGLSGTYPAIRKQLAGAAIIPSEGCYERQFLRTKRRLLTQRVGSIGVCGVAYEVCIGELCALLRGEASDISRRSYAITAERMGWSRELFEKVRDRKLNAQIIERLTDKDSSV